MYKHERSALLSKMRDELARILREAEAEELLADDAKFKSNKHTSTADLRRREADTIEAAIDIMEQRKVDDE